jgi:hypothetical protein
VIQAFQLPPMRGRSRLITVWDNPAGLFKPVSTP